MFVPYLIELKVTVRFHMEIKMSLILLIIFLFALHMAQWLKKREKNVTHRESH